MGNPGYNVHRCSDRDRAAMIDMLKARLRTVDQAESIPYPPMAAYHRSGRLVKIT